MKKVLLHICCGVCALSSILRLRDSGFAVTGFFYNPNIHPEQEYFKRKQALAQIGSLEIIEGNYDWENWFKLCQGYNNEPEGGRRCLICYELRLRKTWELCANASFDFFTTTLTISPHKDSSAIINIGKQIGGDKFLAIDFKQDQGFQQTMALAKQNNLYRQKYCGCEYSKR
jgi:hypothetical protein